MNVKLAVCRIIKVWVLNYDLLEVMTFMNYLEEISFAHAMYFLEVTEYA